MNRETDHTDPFAAFSGFFEKMCDDIVEGIAVRMHGALRQPTLDLDALGIEPMRAYSAKETARLLGTRRVASVYEIPETELPRVRRIGSGVGFLGINILCYMHGVPPVDMEGAIDQYRQRLFQNRPTVQALRPAETGKTRVL